MALVITGSFHDWLSQSSYVWGKDQTAAVVSRKKRRAHRKEMSAEVKEHAKHQDRAMWDSSGRVNNRRYRRWLNDQLLRDLAPPMEAAEISSLFAPPPWGEQRVITPLERVTVGGGARGAVDMAGWEPFRNVDMDTQARWIISSEEKQRAARAARSHHGRQAFAMEAWKGVEHKAREALRRNSQSPLLQAFEEKLLVFLSEGKEKEEDDRELSMEAETSYHRLLLHGLTQFHGLKSRTFPAVSNDHAVENWGCARQSVMLIRKKDSKSPKRTSISCNSDGPLNLVEFLQEIQHRSVEKHSQPELADSEIGLVDWVEITEDDYKM